MYQILDVRSASILSIGIIVAVAVLELVWNSRSRFEKVPCLWALIVAISTIAIPFGFAFICSNLL